MKGIQIKYSSVEIDFLQSNATIARSKLTEMFNAQFDRNLTTDQIKAKCTREGFKTGRDGRFKKGGVRPKNSGAKGPNSTSFKKGDRPMNWRPVGSSRISKDGYAEIKVAEPNKWRLLHHVVWEQANGKPPRYHCIAFIDGDKTNVALNNLELISRATNAAINKMQPSSYSDEIRPTIRAIGKLTAKRFEVAKTTG